MYKKLLMLAAVFLTAATYAFAQSGSISGTVTDSESGEPLPATNVFIQELQRGTSTNANGEYSFQNISPGNYTLRVTFVGYAEVTQAVEVDNSETTADITMSSSSQKLDELVVVGYGTQERRKIVGSVSSINSEELSEGNNITVDKALQGKTAGVQVTSTSGVLGAPVSVRVRGTSSINASSQPLYVVDGIPMVDNEIGGTYGVGGEGGINPLINLNQDDIKSVEVLKDASATAVYGSRGANGVVLITTKSGSAGESQIDIGVSAGFSDPTEEYSLLSGPEFIEMLNYKNGVTGTENALDPSTFGNTDWADVVTRQGAVQNYNASISGGDETTQYYISGLFSKEQGYARPNELKKYSARARVDHKFNDNLHVMLSVSPSRTNNNRIPTSNQVSAPYTYSALIAPTIPEYLPNGDINDGRDPSAPGNAFGLFGGTPSANIQGNDITSITTQVTANASVSYDFIENLTLKSDFSVQNLQNRETSKYATYTTDGFPNGFGSALDEEFLNYSWNNTLTYIQDWENHGLNVTLGATLQRNEQVGFNVSGNTFASNALPTLNSAASITAGGGFISSYAFQNNLARISYDYKDKYLITLTGSYNGSSRFPKDERYGFFPAVAAGWVISDEAFMENADFLSFLKLRASYGITGNAGINNFQYLGLLGSGADYDGQPGLDLSQLDSPMLSWEENNQFDIGIDYGFLNGRISGTLGYYNKQSKELLLDTPVSNTNGFTEFTENAGGMLNEGIEFDISADILQGDFLWSVNANVSTLHNEVTDLPVEAYSVGENRVEEGQPIGAFYVPEYRGVDPENGDALYTNLLEDEEGNFTGEEELTNNFNEADRQFLGDPQADLFGGFGTRLGYKGIDASVNFQYSYGNKIYWSDGEFLTTNLGSVYNQQRSQLDYWTPENTDASVPEPRPAPNGNSPSSRYLQDGSYLRLKTATIGYTLPKELVSGYDLRIYAQGTNLLTFTKFEGLDPEITPTSGSNVQQGNVFFQLPQSRTILFGIELGL